MAGKSLLREGTIPSDYRSLRSQVTTLGTESALRAEYSRLRSIVRKRIERMEQAGETTNRFYEKFGNLAEALPTAKGRDTRDLSMRLSVLAKALGGGYTGTVKEIKEERKRQAERFAQAAEDSGDEETAEYFRDAKNITKSQWDKIHRMMGIVWQFAGRSISSKEVEAVAAKTVLSSKGQKKSVLQMAAEVMRDLGLDDVANLEDIQQRYKKDGRLRASWKKARNKRGF